MLNGSGGERLGLEHPMWDQSLLATFSRDSIMANSAGYFCSQDQCSLIVERMVGIADDKRLSLVMDSMLIIRSLLPFACSSIWLAIRTASPSLIGGWSASAMVALAFATKITPAVSTTKS